jgi:predicted AAA+ superfamily ATPase
MAVVRRFFTPPRESFFLFGPRGTGKSTWARAALPDALWIDLLDPETLRACTARPERLAERLAAEPGKRTVVIDEVQRAPELLSVVHSTIETRKGLRFVLTGSSARKLRRGAANLLAGRALVKSLHPFLAAELGPRFRLERALAVGMVPLVVDSANPEEKLRAYHALYLKEEVQAEGLVRNVGSFARFVEAISLSHGAVLNLSNVARECEVSRKTVEGYLGILEDLMLGARLPIFTRRAKRLLAGHPKFYLFDCGVFRAARPRGPIDAETELEGAALEGLVFQHLRAWNAYRNERNTLAYWRTRNGREVDFVLHGSDGFVAIEVKNSRRVHPLDAQGLRAFREDYPEARALLLHRGKDRALFEGEVQALPVEEFLLGLDPAHGGLPGVAGR